MIPRDGAALADVRKQLSQLELSLSNFRQGVEIPDVHLATLPEIKAALAKVRRASCLRSAGWARPVPTLTGMLRTSWRAG